LPPVEARLGREPLPADSMSPVTETDRADGFGNRAVRQESSTMRTADVAVASAPSNKGPHDRTHRPVQTICPRIDAVGNTGSDVSKDRDLDVLPGAR
jgi:hypothetical protein